MKLKNFFCVLLTLIVLISCFGVSAAAASSPSSDAPITVLATGKFSMDVPGNTAVKAGSSFPLEVGEVVTIKATYSPFSASVDFGVIAPDGGYYGFNITNGSIDKTIRVSESGDYILQIRNNSSTEIEVSGFVNY